MDVLQEAYLEAHKSFSRFEYTGDEAFSRWLCRIIENCIRGLADYHGAKKRRAPGAVLHTSTVMQRIRDSATGVVTKADRMDSRERLARAMEELEEDQREVLLLRHFQDLTIDEIAHRTGRSPTAVRRLIGKAMTRLGGLLARSR
jgi:RNA polymerase sigma-70 factor (ECF subfamily)